MLTSFRKGGSISTYRNEIYGISIISIIIFHYFEDIAGAMDVNKNLLLKKITNYMDHCLFGEVYYG